MTMDLSPDALNALADDLICQTRGFLNSDVRMAGARASDALRALAAERAARADRPAAEVGEPSYCQPPNCGQPTPRIFIVRYDDADMPDAYFTDEAEARAHFRAANVRWNCYLFGTFPALTREDDQRTAFVPPVTLAPATRTTSPDAGEVNSDQPATFVYRNWRGEVATRTVTPQSLWFGSTEWHPEPQWFLKAIDRGKGAPRDFALRDINASDPARDAAAAERAREACVAGAQSVIVAQEEFIERATAFTRRDKLLDAAAVRLGAEEVLKVIRALSLADLLRPEGARAEPSKPVSRSGDPKLDVMIAQAEADYAALTPGQKADADRLQRESWVRGQTGLGWDADERRERAALREGAQAEGEASRG